MDASAAADDAPSKAPMDSMDGGRDCSAATDGEASCTNALASSDVPLENPVS